MPLSIGDRLGPYEVYEPIGKGGMGEVYRARDPRLNRDVAIKISAAQFSERFEREAKAIASLNHPNICQIYDVGPNYLVMEYIEGDAPKGPIPLDEVLRIARQIAAALEAAHYKGITHRDLKPGNIKIKRDGTVKVLDFGLAKLTAAASGSGENSPTLTIGMTEAGMILGTASYMAPEQARGKESVDKRADIWAFGVVLYELASGKRLFQGEDVGEILAKVIRDEPDLSNLPAGLRPLLKRCLEKDPKKRLRDIGDMELLLANASDLSVSVSSKPRSSWDWVPWSLAVIGAACALVLASLHFRQTIPLFLPARFNINVPGNILGFLELSPDGHMLSYISNEGGQANVWVRPLDSLEARKIPGTEGALFPFWSPDSQNLGFFAQGKLKRIALAGGPAQTLCAAPSGRGGSWNRQGVIVFAPNIEGSLYRISVDGGVPTQITKAGRYPEFIQGSNLFLFLDEIGFGTEDGGISVGSLDGAAPVRILSDRSRAIYVPSQAGGRTGHILFRREDTLMALPFNVDKLAAHGPAVSLVEHVIDAGTLRYGGFAASENGVLVNLSGQGRLRRTLTWLDRSGKQIDGNGEPRPYAGMTLAPDEKSAAVSLGPEEVSSDLWLEDLAIDLLDPLARGSSKSIAHEI